MASRLGVLRALNDSIGVGASGFDNRQSTLAQDQIESGQPLRFKNALKAALSAS